MDLAAQILAANEAWVTQGFPGSAALPPARHLVVVTCMDSRIDVFSVIGLKNGDAHIVRNAGGIVTEDAQRSIALSQRNLGTVDVVVVQHTDCGMQGFDARTFRQRLEDATGQAPPWDVDGFTDVKASVRQQVAAIRANPWLRHDGEVAGFVYDVDTGRLDHVV